MRAVGETSGIYAEVAMDRAGGIMPGMAAPKFSPVAPLDDARGYESPDHVPDAWTADRPAELAGPPAERRPARLPGARPGLRPLAGRPAPARGPSCSRASRVDDALSGCTAVALRRASLYGRAPVIHDLRIAFTIWGFFDADPAGRARRPAPRRCSRASPTASTTTTSAGPSSTRSPRPRCA